MEKLVIGNSVRNIRSEAFRGCDGLRRIELLASIPPLCASDAFSFDAKLYCELIVPEGRVEIYKKDSVWKCFSKISAGLDGVLADKTDVNVVAVGGEVVVSGAGVENAEVEVYGIGGALVYKGKSHSISVPRSGVYIVIVAGKAQKVIVP